MKIHDSSSDNLLQLADMVVGGLARSFGSKTDANVYRGLVRDKEKQVQFWPK